MNTLTRKTALTLSATFALIGFVALPAQASHPQVLVVPPTHGLPAFGFSSFNIHGFGERVTYVRWGSLAAQLGLEPGDTILSMNGFPLTYHGAWNDALYQALASGGWVQLTIRDVRTGHVAYRQTYVGSGPIVGPITPKYHGGGHIVHHPPVIHHKHHVGYPSGPVTAKSKVGPPQVKSSNTLKKIAKLFD